MAYSYAWLYEAYDALQAEATERERQRRAVRNPLQAYMHRVSGRGARDGFARMAECRRALEALDGRGWQRSFHQRLFHDNFIRCCARVFFKTEPPGAFARAHQSVLDLNGWDNLSQEVLISTPRRFGKTISVSMFAAAVLFSASSVELSIYSTCKRISQKLLRNVQKFLALAFEATGMAPYKEIRSNMEELVLQGPDGTGDVRIVNSYPSKVVPRPHTPAAWNTREVRVLPPSSVPMVPARAKRCCSSCSASSWRARRAPRLHWMLGLMSYVISRMRREKVAWGMLRAGSRRRSLAMPAGGARPPLSTDGVGMFFFIRALAPVGQARRTRFAWTGPSAM